MSPYEIVFGRHRPMAGLPYRPERAAEDAVQFLDKMGRVDKEIAAKLNEQHAKRAAAMNAKRREPPPLEVGRKVWYRPEPQPGRDKLEPTWKGPGTVRERIGAHSYVVELAPGKGQEAHRSQLRPHIEDKHTGETFPLYYFTGKAPVLEASLAPDEWVVESVDGHRMSKQGEPEFLIRWRGYGPDERTWEPMAHLLNTVLGEYFEQKGLTPREKMQVREREEGKGGAGATTATHSHR